MKQVFVFENNYKKEKDSILNLLTYLPFPVVFIPSYISEFLSAIIALSLNIFF